VSRPTKCRHGAARGSRVLAINHTRTTSSDECLLVEIQGVREQRLEPTYRRKLDAVALLLQRYDTRRVEQRAKASLRTVQRWARRVRRVGPDALRSRARNCQTAKLSDKQLVLLTNILKRRSANLGSGWSAALLMQRIRENYA
jgi:hypothetical protein